MKLTRQAALIARNSLFTSLTGEELELVASKLKPRTFAPGELLMKEGATDDHLFILQAGEVEVIKALGSPDERLLSVQRGQALFGEMRLFDPQGGHSASVRARTTVFALEMTLYDFDALLHRRPSLVYDMLRQAIRRLQESENVTILDLREKNRQLSQAYQELKEAQAQLILKETLEKELAIAREIQKSILPDRLPHLDGFDIAALSMPARAVGGDYYDAFSLDGGRVGLVVGDACDKGVPAALFINLTDSLVRVEAPYRTSPEETLRQVNRHLIEMNRSGMFASLLYGVLNVEGHFDYCRAGHPYPLVMDADGRLLQTGTGRGMALGIQEEIMLDARSVTIPRGGLALVYSDGLSEAMDAHQKPFGEERLPVDLAAIRHLPAADICARLWNLVKEFGSGQPQSDDFTVLVIKRA